MLSSLLLDGTARVQFKDWHFIHKFAGNMQIKINDLFVIYLLFVAPEFGLGEASEATLGCPTKGAATGACCVSNSGETKKQRRWRWSVQIFPHPQNDAAFLINTVMSMGTLSFEGCCTWPIMSMFSPRMHVFSSLYIIDPKLDACFWGKENGLNVSQRKWWFEPEP